MMEGKGENGPSNCSWEVYLGAEAFCWYRYALLLWSSTPHTKGDGRVERARQRAPQGIPWCGENGSTGKSLFSHSDRELPLLTRTSRTVVLITVDELVDMDALEDALEDGVVAQLRG